MGKWVGAGDASANRGSVLTGVTNSGSRHPQAPTLGAARLAAHLLLRLLDAPLAKGIWEIGVSPAFAYWASTTRGSFVIAVRVDRVAGMPRAAVLSTVTRHLCLGDDFFPYVFWFSRWWLRQYGVLRWDSPTPGTSMPGLASGVLRALLKSGRLGGLGIATVN